MLVFQVSSLFHDLISEHVLSVWCVYLVSVLGKFSQMYDNDEEACVIPGSLSEYPRPSVSSNIEASSQCPGISVSPNIQALPQYPGISMPSIIQTSPQYPRPSVFSNIQASRSSPQYQRSSTSADTRTTPHSTVVSATTPQPAFAQPAFTSPETSLHRGARFILAPGSTNPNPMIAPSTMGSDEMEIRRKKLYTCDACHTTFTSTSGLKNHKKQVHLNIWKFECHICQKKFMFKEHYEGHMNMHFNIKAFKCPNCPKKFAYKTGVSLHLRNGSCENRRRDSHDEHSETP